jgi:glycosyltransferase involved in cell wall biosynthesis
MNILFFIPSLSKSSGGIYQYSITLLKNLLKDSNNNKYYIYNNLDIDDLNRLTKQYPDKILLLDSDDINEPFFNYFNRGMRKILSILLNKIHLKLTIRRSSDVDHLIKKYNIDVIHSPIVALPIYSNASKVATIHDVLQLHYPDYFTSDELNSRKINFKSIIDVADAVIVSYEHIKKDIIRFFNKDSQKIHVCLLNMEDLWFSQFDEKSIINLDAYNLPSTFILFPSATWEHKNHKNLLEAIHYLKAVKGIHVNLVCTGHQTRYFENIKRKVNELGIEDQVWFLGIVSDRDLFSLYRKCSGVVIPTLYEAGSFPLMESILMGIPVICSNVTSLPETIGDDQFTFDPSDYAEMAEKIERLVFDEKYRLDNIENSKKQSVRLKNENLAKSVNRVYFSLKENQK